MKFICQTWLTWIHGGTKIPALEKKPLQIRLCTWINGGITAKHNEKKNTTYRRGEKKKEIQLFINGFTGNCPELMKNQKNKLITSQADAIQLRDPNVLVDFIYAQFFVVVAAIFFFFSFLLLYELVPVFHKCSIQVETNIHAWWNENIIFHETKSINSQKGTKTNFRFFNSWAVFGCCNFSGLGHCPVSCF